MPPTDKAQGGLHLAGRRPDVAPGVLVLKVVFDQQMTPRDFAYGLGATATS
jgi:hypothetical protein